MIISYIIKLLKDEYFAKTIIQLKMLFHWTFVVWLLQTLLIKLHL